MAHLWLDGKSFGSVRLKITYYVELQNTVKSVLEAAASNHFDEFFGQNLLSKKLDLLRLLFEGGFYLRAASNTDDTVC